MKFLASIITLGTAAALLAVGLFAAPAAHAQKGSERIQAGPGDRQARLRDAFTVIRFASTDELVLHLQNDARLRKLYARHFKISEAEVLRFFSESVIPQRLDKTMTVTVYGVTKSGKIYAVKTRLRKGTLVWTTRSGMLILKWICGNPFTDRLPIAQAKVPPRSVPIPVAKGGEVESSASVVPIESFDVPTVAGTEDLALALPGEPTLTFEDNGAVLEPIPFSQIGPAAGTIVRNAGKFNPGIPLVAAGGFLALSNGGGGTTNRDGFEVPEPASGLLLAGPGLLAVGGWVRRRRARQTR